MIFRNNTSRSTYLFVNGVVKLTPFRNDDSCALFGGSEVVQVFGSDGSSVILQQGYIRQVAFYQFVNEKLMPGQKTLSYSSHQRLSGSFNSICNVSFASSLCICQWLL